jgi:DNA-binding transcriptional ArsR family regulator
MSVRAMAWAWRQQLSGPEKLVLMAVADHADDDGICWPGNAHIARKCNLSQRSVQRHIKNLIDNGYMTARRRYRETGGQTSNLYVLNVEGVTHSHGGGDRLTWGDDTSVAPITIIEPSYEKPTTTDIELPEWMAVLCEKEKPEQDTIKRMLRWAVPHDDTTLRETAYALVEKWDSYKDKRKNIWSTFQGWVRVAERSEKKRGPIRAPSVKLNPQDSIAIEKAIADAGLHPGSSEAREMRRRLQQDGYTG